MKTFKIISTALFTISSLIISCQTYPLENTPNEMPNGSYAKDINNTLQPYIGTWQGTFNGDTIILVLEKEKRKVGTDTDYYFVDALIGKHKVIDSNGSLIEDYAGQSLNIPKLIGSSWKIHDGVYDLSYYGNETDPCDVYIDFFLVYNDATPNQLQLKPIMTWEAVIPDDGSVCPNTEGDNYLLHNFTSYHLPTSEITLTKQ